MPRDLNYYAILVSAVLYFALGAVWYGVFFGKAWMAMVGKTEEELRKGGMAAPYITAAVTALVCAALLAFVLRRTGNDATIGQAMGMSFLLWLGFAIGTGAKHYAFPGRPARLLLIDYGYDLVAFLAMSLIFALWK